MALTQFPTSLPVEDLEYLVAELTGQQPDLKQTIASLYALIGYAGGQVLNGPHGIVPKLVGPPTVFHKQALAAHLQSALAGSNAVDWGAVLQIVLSLVQTYLAQHPVA